MKSSTFPVLGPQKTSQNLVFIKGFEQGTQKGAFGAQKCTLGPRIAVSVNIATFGASGWKKPRILAFYAQTMVFYKEY